MADSAEGYDTNRFQSTIDEGLTCCICLGVLKDPMQCENNEHYFCSGCIEKHLEMTSETCPVCQEKLTIETLRKAPRIIADLISRLKIKCDHAARGCDAVVELVALQAHVLDCDFMPVPCSNDGCDEMVSRCDAKQHEKELCRFKTMICSDCGKKMPHQKYGGHGCVLRRDVDEIRKDLREMKQQLTTKIGDLQSSLWKLRQSVDEIRERLPPRRNNNYNSDRQYRW